MIDSKYNKFIVCWLTDNLELLFDSHNKLIWDVPFGNYKIGDIIDEDSWETFEKLYNQYLSEHNMSILNTDITGFDSYGVTHSIVFTYDDTYYKVPLDYETEGYLGWSFDISWINDNLEKYKVVPKTITTTIYEYV